jgi:glutamyl-tRNA synthetase
VRDAVREAIDGSRFSEDELIGATGCDDAEAFNRWRKKKSQLEVDGLERTAALLGVALPEIDIHDFRRSGYLPEVILNFIALLGWSPGEDREKMTLDEMGAAFGVERIGKTNAKFDRDKLLSFNTDAAHEAGADRLLAAFRDFVAANPGSPLVGCDDAILGTLIEISKGFRTFRDIESKTAAIFAGNDAFDYDDAAFAKVLLKNDGEGLGVLRELRGGLEGVTDWQPESLDAWLRDFGAQRQLGLGRVAQPLRVAVMGNTISPPIFDTLVLIGRDNTLARIDRALAYAAATA